MAYAPPDGPHILDELLHLHVAQPGLLAVPRQTVHQFLQVLSVQHPIIIKVFGERKVSFWQGRSDPRESQAPTLGEERAWVT